MNAVKALNHPYQESAITCLASALSTNRQTFNNVFEFAETDVSIARTMDNSAKGLCIRKAIAPES